MKQINSEGYWEERFASGDWNKNNGREQTSYFYRLLMQMMPQWAKSDIIQNEYELVDFGCAEGQGLPIITAELGIKIRGIDFSESAIQNASILFPDFQFEVGDIWTYNQENDVSIVSNVIEHFDQPFAVLKRIASLTRKYIVVMVPLEEVDLMPEHKFTFLYSNIPTVIEEFQLVYFAEHDCRKDKEQLFLGKQVFLLYSRNNEICNNNSIEASNGLVKMIRAQREEQQLLDEISSITKLMMQMKNDLNEQFELINTNVSNLSNDTAEQYVNKFVEEIEKKNLELQTMNAENTRLIDLYNDVDSKYIDLSNRFNDLNDTYGKIAEENYKIKNSRTYKFAMLTWKMANKMHLTGVVRLLLNARYIGLKQAFNQRKIKKIQNKKESILVPIDLDDQEIGEVRDDLMSCSNDVFEQSQLDELNNKKDFYLKTISLSWSETTHKISKLIEKNAPKGIVVYPYAINWEPLQRPQHFLREFAKKGYSCFFCDSSKNGIGIEEKFPNVYVVYGEEHLIPVLQNRCPIVMVTWHMQTPFLDVLPQKLIWFDLLDNLDFFSGGNTSLAKSIYSKLISDADVVSYSADNLKKYLGNRSNAIKINNGVMLADFEAIDPAVEISELALIKKRGKKIVGYYGAIEEWFDKEIIRVLLNKTDVEIVLIGRVGIDLSDLFHERLHVLGMLPYIELCNYAKYFDLALIPFIKNELTDAVSPVKFYEYVAQGIPVLSSDIREMRQYASEQVRIYHNEEELINFTNDLCAKHPDVKMLKEIASQNTWEKRVEKVMEAIAATWKGLRVLADFRTNEGIAVETVTFFKYDGSTYYSGGAERYLLDLNDICVELNVPYRVYQYGEYNWVRYYNNMQVIGMQAGENDVNLYTVPLVQEMNNIFERETTQSNKLNIYSPFYILNRRGSVPSIGISHGISWDSEYNHFTEGNAFWQVNKNVIDAAGLCDQMISVDTNTCNWFQTLDYNIGRKIHYIPNYVDNEEFSPRQDYLTFREKVIITYPRRLYGARGLYVVLDVIDDILSQYSNVEFHFVGKGFGQDTKHVEKKIEKWGKRIQWYSKAPDQMPEVYKMTDISLIPTMYSEGTSLSCLEALSSGNVVIATRVGGLTDLILSDYNGKLVEPTGDAIKDAIFDLLDHPEKMQRLKRNAVETAHAFSKEKWKKEWKDVISSFVDGTENYMAPSRCMIKIRSNADLMKTETLSLIREYLEAGWYVYVACKNNSMRYNSYKRLQFINLNEDLYFVPEKTICL